MILFLGRMHASSREQISSETSIRSSFETGTKGRMQYLLLAEFEGHTVRLGPVFPSLPIHEGHELKWKKARCHKLQSGPR